MTGKVLNNRYELVEKIGSGGMADVYKARCRVLKRWVAVKILKDEFVNDEEFLERFEREAYAAASLNHPNIVSIYDVGKEGNIHYIVMEYIDGITLKEYIRQNGALPWQEAADIAIAILSALHKAHRQGIIHRDIKPQNILMTSDHVPKVTDFGIARAVTTSTVTRKVDTVGSVHYSSPEQARGGYTDEKSDIYSVGVTLFEMLTGRVPFDADNPVSVALKHIEEKPARPSSIVPDIPEAMDEIVLRALGKSRSERYDNALQMIADLDHVKKGEALERNGGETDLFATRVIGSLEEESLAAKKDRGRNRKKGKAGKTSKKGFLIASVYILLIGIIVGGIWLVYDKVVKDVVGAILAPKKQPVEVINYIGMHIEDAIADLEAKNLPYAEPVYEYSDTVPKGVVMDQRPPAGISIMPGDDAITKVELIVSNGPEMVTIPTDIKFADYVEAEIKLKNELKLQTKVVDEYSDEVAEGRVIRTEPEMGSVVAAGSEVIIYRSLGPKLENVVVPDVTGRTLDEARNILLEHNLSIGKIYPEDREGYKGRIINQEPKAGTVVKELTAVNLYFADEQSPSAGDGSGIDSGISDSADSTRITKQIYLPPDREFGDTVEVEIYYTTGDSGEEIFLKRATLNMSEFPYTVLVPVTPGVKTTLFVYMDGELQYREEILIQQ
ncbi:Stk1 family PASTA domain-containing Ser/Thr kinase [Thermoclostridium stercorarium]|jgi:beta-lactam-binding protein with PASTA domain/tRNA A-37 threonylcarbamoyl transferase component Bud32|uniref:non-specific serine/threonine protein kinase n=1 Tax=Thermoclostridium stercorarium subsp. leptospartum DSM 9219 TaxID=1346611 RepID=A0A1B1YMG1_THEST|nr:Stk1 family PASTA domain-containing Ser/Thr kinase [Thermoclostridium stercorarium]ANX01958.1 serine/threonine protein kinase [Thermoclostridium stercorarium subsp. leptospartum DSM 9219]UZQ85000.1 Stk1 family PASTA domain-containing Ser/Thr kinase [Thermoclostridium stercorarium]